MENEKIRESERKYQQIVENAAAIILKFDRNGVITFINTYRRELFSYAEEELIGHPITDTIVPQAESTGRDLTKLIRDIIDHPENYRHNLNENITKAGHRLWIEWNECTRIRCRWRTY